MWALCKQADPPLLQYRTVVRCGTNFQAIPDFEMVSITCALAIACIAAGSVAAAVGY